MVVTTRLTEMILPLSKSKTLGERDKEQIRDDHRPDIFYIFCILIRGTPETLHIYANDAKDISVREMHKCKNATRSLKDALSVCLSILGMRRNM